MKRINPQSFRVARKGTSRKINRQIVLSLLRTHQPISRADLARLMKVNRANITLLIKEMTHDSLVFEGATGAALRGRKPTLLYLKRRSVVAVDIRPTRTYIMLTDFIGKQLGDLSSFPTLHRSNLMISELSKRIKRLLKDHPDAGPCAGVGVAVPGMVDCQKGIVLNAPPLHWRDVKLQEHLASAVGLPVQIENSGRACALAQIWSAEGEFRPTNDLVFVSVTDGIGVGMVVGGELMRGHNNIAGQFAHIPLQIDGPRCSCGANGCWEAFVANTATVSRYLGKLTQRLEANGKPAISIDDVIARARAGDEKAMSALKITARYLGLGLSMIVKAIDPNVIYLTGEITTAWDLIEPAVQSALRERTLTVDAAAPLICLVPANEHPRLRGAAMLISAPTFAAPAIA